MAQTRQAKPPKKNKKPVNPRNSHRCFATWEFRTTQQPPHAQWRPPSFNLLHNNFNGPSERSTTSTTSISARQDASRASLYMAWPGSALSPETHIISVSPSKRIEEGSETSTYKNRYPHSPCSSRRTCSSPGRSATSTDDRSHKR